MAITDPIVILSAADDNFAMPLGVMIHSVLKNIDPEAILHFYVLDGGIREDNRRRLQRVFQHHGEKDRHKLEWIDPDISSIEYLPSHEWMSEATYLRLLIPEILPTGWEKVIYLDCDLVLEADIAQLWNHSVTDTVLWAARDVLIQTLAHPKGVEHYELLGGRDDSPYFNSGVLLINVNRWRSEKISEQAIDYLLKNRETFKLHEQEALNAVLIGKWRELDPRWNQQVSIFQFNTLPASEFTEEIKKMYDDLVSDPFIIHYLSPSKPWHFDCIHPVLDRFLLYLKESEWFTGVEWNIWW